MRLSVDGKEINCRLDDSLTLKEVLEATSEEIYGAQRVVIGLEIDGKSFMGNDNELAAALVENTEEFNIVTSPIKDIIINSLIAANSHLPQLISGIERCAGLLQNDQTTEGMQLLQQVVAGLGGFIEVVDKSTQVITSALVPSVVEDLPLMEKRVAINDILNRIVEHLNKGDFITVSSLLEGELVEILSDWVIFIPRVVERIKTGLN